MNDVSLFLIHNNSKDRIDIRNNLKNLSKNLNINLTEIYKQNKNLLSTPPKDFFHSILNQLYLQNE